LNVFNELKRLPNPIPGPDKHYMSFSEVYKTETTEEYCPSLQKRKSRNMPNNIEKKGGNGMDFSPTAQFAKNVRTVVKCTECNKPHVLYAHRKISEEEYHLLQPFLESVEYVCGLSFKGLTKLSSSKGICYSTDKDSEKENEDIAYEKEIDPIAKLFKLVQINKKHTCNSIIEKPYFVAKIFPQICNICGISEDVIQIGDDLPSCKECHAKTGKKRKMGRTKYFDADNKKRQHKTKN
jgi:hypothetical protein